MEFNKKLNMVIDVDEVLTCISPVWIGLLSKDYDYYNKYMMLPENYDINRDFNKVLLRNNFYLEVAYGKPCLKDGSLSKDEIDNFMKNYFALYDHDTFYTKLCRPTKMFHALKGLIGSCYVNKAHIVSRCFEHNRKGKTEFIEKFLGKELMKNVELHYLSTGEQKSDYIKELGNIDVIYDDELKNVIDIMKNVPMNERGTDIYNPLYGYNLPNPELFELSESSGYNIQYYEAIKGFNASTYKNFVEFEGM